MEPTVSEKQSTEYRIGLEDGVAEIHHQMQGCKITEAPLSYLLMHLPKIRMPAGQEVERPIPRGFVIEKCALGTRQCHGVLQFVRVRDSKPTGVYATFGHKVTSQITESHVIPTTMAFRASNVPS